MGTWNVPKESFLPLTRDEVSREQFARIHEAMLKTTEKAKPFGRLRELRQSIAKGEAKLSAAEKQGVSPDDEGYKRGLAKLAAYREEARELTRKHQIPHFALAMVHEFLRASEGWGLPAGSYVEVKLPTIFSVKVDVANEEIPF